MVCLKCGNEMNENEQVCSKCGYNKNTNSNTDNPFGVKNQGIYNPNAVDKDVAAEKLEHQKQFHQLVEIYIGPKYYNFKKGSFSWCAFFLGPLYFLYRKLYAVGMVIFLINIIINAIFGVDTSGIDMNNINNALLVLRSKEFLINAGVVLIFQIFLGIIFKKFYFNECMERVGKIKQQNPDKGYNQLVEIVKAKGGTNLLAALLPIIILIILAIISLIGLIILGSTLG